MAELLSERGAALVVAIRNDNETEEVDRVKRKTQRLTAWALAAALGTGMLPLTALAADSEPVQEIVVADEQQAQTVEESSGPCGEGLHWTLDSSGALKIEGRGIVKKAEEWDRLSHSIKSIAIASGVTEIGAQAFENLGFVEKITISDTVTAIGDRAFAGVGSSKGTDAGVIQAVLPDSVQTIGKQAFAESAVFNMRMGSGLREIGDQAFYKCKELHFVVMPKTVKRIGKQAFYECDIMNHAFLPSELIYLGEQAFYHCAAIQSVHIPGGLKQIEAETFRGCSDLRGVTFAEGLESIGDAAFKDCPKMITEDYTTHFPSTLRKIGKEAFMGTDLRGVVVANNIETIGVRAFADCKKLGSITLEEGVTSIGNQLFSGCEQLTELELPKSLTSIGARSFYRCPNLRLLVLPCALKEIGESAFQGCKGLYSVAIPKSLTKIGKSAFHQTTPQGIYYAGSKESWGKISIAADNTALSKAEQHNHMPIELPLEEMNVDNLWSSPELLIGQEAVFSVQATGTGLLYQWQTWNGSKWVNETKAGSNTNTLRIIATSATNHKKVRCVIRDFMGEIYQSPASELILDGEVTVTSQTGLVVTPIGHMCTIKLKTTGNVKSYQWQSKGPKAKKWTNSTVSGSQSSTIRFKATENTNGMQYRCIIRDYAGGKIVTSPSIVWLSHIYQIIIQPSDNAVESGEKVSFRVMATGGKKDYQWQYRMKKSEKWKNCTQNTAHTDQLQFKAKKSQNKMQVRCVIKNSKGKKLTSETARLFVQG